MIEFLALLIMDKHFAITESHYQVNHCYNNGSDYRPNTIKITGMELKGYLYKVYQNKLYSDEFYGSFDTIEQVYNKEIKCPN